MQAVWEWLQENWFGVVGIFIGLLGGWLIALWQRTPKTLDYQQLSEIKLLSRPAKDVAGGRVKVTLDDQPMDDPHITTIRIVNTGRKAVRGEDYESAIEVTFAGNLPADVDLADASHPALEQQIFPYEVGPAGVHTVEFEPKLMNAGEWFDITLISDGPVGPVEVTSRFADQSRPMRRLTRDNFAAAEDVALQVNARRSVALASAVISGFTAMLGALAALVIFK